MWYVFQLIYTVDRFLNSEDVVNDIENVDLEDKDCRFIYDCLSFWKLFDDQKKGKKITSPPAKYIRTKLDQIKKPLNPVIYKKLRITKFTALKSQINSNQYR